MQLGQTMQLHIQFPEFQRQFQEKLLVKGLLFRNIRFSGESFTEYSTVS